VALIPVLAFSPVLLWQLLQFGFVVLALDFLTRPGDGHVSSAPAALSFRAMMRLRVGLFEIVVNSAVAVCRFSLIVGFGVIH